jgi:hypothetical protein
MNLENFKMKLGFSVNWDKMFFFLKLENKKKRYPSVAISQSDLLFASTEILITKIEAVN